MLIPDLKACDATGKDYLKINRVRVEDVSGDIYAVGSMAVASSGGSVEQRGLIVRLDKP
jgi:hypothetical protein